MKVIQTREGRKRTCIRRRHKRNKDVIDSKKSPNLENSPKVIAIDQGWVSGQLLGQRA